MIRNKKLAPNAVLDDEGRQRFHGAFTGGFSAGHYNTVGSEEGFKPSTFTSSRSHRATRKEQSANDFVDAEDGLIGGVLSTKNVRLSPWLQSYFYAVHNKSLHSSFAYGIVKNQLYFQKYVYRSK
jgi:Protein of unknown function (DUF1604)